MAFADSWFFVTPILIYLILIAVITVLAYLVLRFAIRDGLRAHSRWLEQRPGTPPTASGESHRDD